MTEQGGLAVGSVGDSDRGCVVGWGNSWRGQRATKGFERVTLLSTVSVGVKKRWSMCQVLRWCRGIRSMEVIDGLCVVHKGDVEGFLRRERVKRK